MTNEKQLEFNTLSALLIEFLNDNYDPHTKIIITTTSSEIVNGVNMFVSEDFIKDEL